MILKAKVDSFFILDTSLIHHFTFLGSDELFKNLYQSIREKNNEFNN